MVDMAENNSRKRGAPKKDPQNVRSERVNVVLTPNTYESLKALATLENDTMNNLIHGLVDSEVEKNRERIDEYVAFMEKMRK